MLSNVCKKETKVKIAFFYIYILTSGNKNIINLTLKPLLDNSNINLLIKEINIKIIKTILTNKTP